MSWAFASIPGGLFGVLVACHVGTGRILRYFVCLMHLLDENERVEADDGYIGEDPIHTKVPKSTVHMHSKKILGVCSKVRCCHKTANKAIKEFAVVASKKF